MPLFSQLESILYGDSLRDHAHFHRPVSGVRNGGIGFKDASIRVGEVRMKAGAV